MSFTPKPIRGSALLASRERRQSRVSLEQKAMQTAKRRDGNQCRWPNCAFRSKKMPVDACHKRHRGMGGNPSGDRTTTDQLISLCRIHHSLWDMGEKDIEPQTAKGFDGPVDFLELNDDNGRMEVWASETVIGVSVERNPA